MKTTTLTALLLFVPAVLGLLDPKIKAKGKKYFGSAADPGTIGVAIDVTILTSDYGAYTPENSMKWDATEPSRGSFTFTNADALVAFAQAHGRLVRGHTLVWHNQLPSWVSTITSAADLTTVIQNHVTTLMARYKGKIYAWDVVNECLNEDGTLRSSVFSRLLGENFIDIAFKAARAADPAAKLYINDFNLDAPGAKTSGMVALVGRLKARGVPIDGIGTQTHIQLGRAGTIAANLQTLANTGLDVAITELDIASSTSSANEAQQSADYATVARACLAVARCVGITTWGVSDKDSWLGAAAAPLLWDTNFVRKPAYTGVDAAFT
ncbi:glycosyl hydrolase family 10 protein [Mycena albidolilacea]|uniref:Beta-xylanase n=1 Tax=Mycena albidolilacea TaxID=1033008 RepID=A0AAD7ERI0_9AGAR|nr:glycosyl hydrolase family 10 protein [Mycena albidolilacea]